MKCPICSDSQLLIAERRGVEIDYCPSCRGVWLDRGELDTIIQRAGEGPHQGRADAGDRGVDSRPRENDDTGHRDPRSQKRGGFLNDLLGGFGAD
jgi:uncharacterized protein